jgi:hypothetical protein
LRKKSKNKEPLDITSDWFFKRTVIPVSPANQRDAWAPSVETLYTLRYYRLILQQIVDKLRGSLMTSFVKSTAMRKKLEQRTKRYLSIETDIEKCGITFPRKLITECIDCISTVYKEVDWRPLMNGFHNMKIMFDGKINNDIIRGYGLGNCNELIDIAHHGITLLVEAAAMHFHDDVIYRYKVPEDVKDIKLFSRERYQELSMTYSDLDVILKPKKTVISFASRILEDYRNFELYGVDYSKKSLLYLPLCNAILARNSALAKAYVHTFSHAYKHKGMNAFYASIASYFVKLRGAEFRNELNIPFELGGWISYGESNLNNILIFLDKNRDYRGMFLNMSREDADALRCQVKPIAYRGRQVDNVYLYDEDPYPFDKDQIPEILREEIFTYNDIIEDSRMSINYKGLNNAKPEIKAAIFDKLENRRKGIRLGVEIPYQQSEELEMRVCLLHAIELGFRDMAIPEIIGRAHSFKSVPFGTKASIFLTSGALDSPKDWTRRAELETSMAFVNEYFTPVYGIEKKVNPKTIRRLRAGIGSLVLCNREGTWPKEFPPYTDEEISRICAVCSNWQLCVGEYYFRTGKFPIITNFIDDYHPWMKLIKTIREVIPEYRISLPGIDRASGEFYFSTIGKIYRISGMGRPLISGIFNLLRKKCIPVGARNTFEKTIEDIILSKHESEMERYQALNRVYKVAIDLPNCREYIRQKLAEELIPKKVEDDPYLEEKRRRVEALIEPAKISQDTIDILSSIKKEKITHISSSSSEDEPRGYDSEGNPYESCGSEYNDDSYGDIDDYITSAIKSKSVDESDSDDDSLESNLYYRAPSEEDELNDDLVDEQVIAAPTNIGHGAAEKTDPFMSLSLRKKEFG